MMSFNITLNNHFTAIRFHVLGTIMMVIVLYFLKWDSDAVMIFSFFWLAYFIPTAYLHIEYYLKNRGQRIEVLESGIVLYDRGGQVRKYNSEGLQKIILYKSASLDKGGIPLTPIESYHYARIIPKQGEEIIVTCLMAADVEETVKKIKWVPYERKKRLFASLNLSLRLLSD